MNENPPRDPSSSPERRSSGRRLSQALRKIGDSGRRLIERRFSNGGSKELTTKQAPTMPSSSPPSSPLEKKVVLEDPDPSVYSELSSGDFSLTIKPHFNRDVSDITFAPPPNSSSLLRAGSLYKDDDDFAGNHTLNIPRTSLRTSVKSFGSLSMSDHVQQGQPMPDLYADDDEEDDEMCDEYRKDQKKLDEYDRMIASFSSKARVSDSSDATTPTPPVAARSLYEDDEDEDDETTHTSTIMSDNNTTVNGHSNTVDENSSDAAIIKTAQDALVTKAAAVQAGYYADPFLPAFLNPHEHRRHVQPMIKRGTFARVACVDKALRSFWEIVQSQAVAQQNEHGIVQVIVLGAGMDTTYFRFRQFIQQQQQQQGTNNSHPSLSWYEVDHATICRDKASRIDRKLFSVEPLKDREWCYRIRDCSSSSDTISHNNPLQATLGTKTSCTLLTHNFKDTDESINSKLMALGCDPSAPTLLLSECVQMYLPISTAQSLWTEMSTTFSNATVVCYEPILGDSHAGFGKMMQANLTRAGLASSSLLQLRTLENHLQHLRAAGWTHGSAVDMWRAYQSILTREEQQHANQCEWLDELEEFIMIMQHYSFIVASQTTCTVGRILCDKQTSPLQFPSVGTVAFS